MDFFDLPKNTAVRRVVPKNAFDSYTNTKQKKQLVDKVHRITWTHKLSALTVNLSAVQIKEIQVFKIELRLLEEIPELLKVIDKAIPYPIIFFVQFEEQAYLATSSKHLHPINEDNAIIDWSFTSQWFPLANVPYKLNLKVSLDQVHKDLCLQLSGKTKEQISSMEELVSNQQRKLDLEKSIAKITAQISKSKQFNEKVKLNLKLKLKEKEKELKNY